MRKIIDPPHKVFNSYEDAIATCAIMELEADEFKVMIDPKGSGRCFVSVIDPIDGVEIARL